MRGVLYVRACVCASVVDFFRHGHEIRTKILQLTPCRIGVPRPYAISFLALLKNQEELLFLWYTADANLQHSG